MTLSFIVYIHVNKWRGWGGGRGGGGEEDCVSTQARYFSGADTGILEGGGGPT